MSAARPSLRAQTLKTRQVARDVTADSFAPLPGASSCAVGSATAGRDRQPFDAGRGEEPGRAAPRFLRFGPGEAAAAGTPSSPAARVDLFITLEDVARICVMDAHEVHFRHRPRYWGIPKHWRWQAGKTWYSMAALPGLVEELELDGEPMAASRLKQFLRDFAAGRGGPETSGGTVGRTTATPAQPWYREGAYA